MWGSQCRCKGSGVFPVSFPGNQELTLPFYLLNQLEATCLLSLEGREEAQGGAVQVRGVGRPTV